MEVKNILLLFFLTFRPYCTRLVSFSGLGYSWFLGKTGFSSFSIISVPLGSRNTNSPVYFEGFGFFSFPENPLFQRCSMKKSFFFLSSILFFFVSAILLSSPGCFKKEETTEIEQDNPFANLPLVPTLSEAELEKLGPKNQIPELNCLPDDGAYGAILYPKKLLASKIGTAGQDLIVPIFTNATNLPVDLREVDFIAINGRLKEVLVPPQPGSSMQPTIQPIQQIVFCVRTAEPFEKTNVLNTLLPPTAGFPPPKMRTVSGKEVYDFPAGAQLETHCIAFLNEKTFLYVLADEQLLKESLDGKAPKGPLAERMLRADMSETELLLIGTNEGNPVLPKEMIRMIANSYPQVPPTLMELLLENFQAIEVKLKLTAKEDEGILSARFDAMESEKAKEIAKVLNDQVAFFRSGISMMQADGGNPDPSSPAPDARISEMGLTFLDAVEVEFGDRSVFAKLKNFDRLNDYVANGFEYYRNMVRMQQQNLEMQRLLEQIFQRMITVRAFMLKHHEEKGRFPSNITDPEGKPLLSWRVSLLPYMGTNERTLYSQFKLDEPWDSPHNRPLVNRMPAIFADPRLNFDPTKTTFQVFNAGGAPFSNSELRMTDIPRPANTAMLFAVGPDYAVEWTNPEPLSLGKTPEEYGKLFGPLVPVVCFDGQYAAPPGITSPEAAELFEKFVKGTPE